jgi:hypothetical protein
MNMETSRQSEISGDYEMQLTELLQSGWDIYDEDVPFDELEVRRSMIPSDIDTEIIQKTPNSYTILAYRGEMEEEPSIETDTPYKGPDSSIRGIEADTRSDLNNVIGDIFKPAPALTGAERSQMAS